MQFSFDCDWHLHVYLLRKKSLIPTAETSIVSRVDVEMTIADCLEGVLGDVVDRILYGNDCISDFCNRCYKRKGNSSFLTVEWLGRSMFDPLHCLFFSCFSSISGENSQSSARRNGAMCSCIHVTTRTEDAASKLEWETKEGILYGVADDDTKNTVMNTFTQA